MTVQELIDKLQKFEDKSKTITGYDLYHGSSLDIVSIEFSEENDNIIMCLDK